ncbi:BZIP domain-containing protein [Plasmodiophora brassicae]|uniref:Uncharacterized protein n=1 Tax=Plasmodiophora brassicae TaxID=37360 RepID=A0A0G4IM58_PLABS|nr:hypothetical protein PBRA_004905 [Plasmodiophora brassicae]
MGAGCFKDTAAPDVGTDPAPPRGPVASSTQVVHAAAKADPPVGEGPVLEHDCPNQEPESRPPVELELPCADPKPTGGLGGEEERPGSAPAVDDPAPADHEAEGEPAPGPEPPVEKVGEQDPEEAVEDDARSRPFDHELEREQAEAAAAAAAPEEGPDSVVTAADDDAVSARNNSIISSDGDGSAAAKKRREHRKTKSEKRREKREREAAGRTAPPASADPVAPVS